MHHTQRCFISMHSIMFIFVVLWLIEMLNWNLIGYLVASANYLSVEYECLQLASFSDPWPWIYLCAKVKKHQGQLLLGNSVVFNTSPLPPVIISCAKIHVFWPSVSSLVNGATFRLVATCPHSSPSLPSYHHTHLHVRSPHQYFVSSDPNISSHRVIWRSEFLDYTFTNLAYGIYSVKISFQIIFYYYTNYLK